MLNLHLKINVNTETDNLKQFKHLIIIKTAQFLSTKIKSKLILPPCPVSPNSAKYQTVVKGLAKIGMIYTRRSGDEGFLKCSTHLQFLKI
jgi:hypothetical protein